MNSLHLQKKNFQQGKIQIRKAIKLLVGSLIILSSAKAQFSNVPVTGFNADVVADGVGSVSSSTTATVDNSQYCLAASNWNFTGACTALSFYMPVSGTVPANSTVANGLVYTLQPYSGLNDLRVPATGSGTTGTGVLTLVTPTQAASLYLLYTGGNGPITSGITVTVTFTDASTQVFSNLTALDWFSTTNPAISNLGRLDRTTVPACATTVTGGPQLFDMPLTLLPSNYSKSVQSITVNKTVTAGIMNVFAVGMMAPCIVPTAQPSFISLAAASSSQINGSLNAATGSPSGYLVVRYPAGSAESVPVNGTTYAPLQSIGLGTVIQSGATTSFSATGLTGGTSYDFYVYSYNSGATCGGPVYLTTSGFFGNQSTSVCTGLAGGSYTVGPTGTYASITAAMTAINAGITGPVILELQPSYVSSVETFPVTFATNACIGPVNTLTIRPATGATGLSITSSNITGTINLTGANYITIDGRPGGTGTTSQLTIGNTNAGTSYAVQFVNDASNNALRYCTVQSVNTSVTSGTIVFGTGLSTGNDNNTIDNCSILDGATTPVNGIYSLGTSAVIDNSGNTVSNSNIANYFSAALVSNGILLGGTGNNGWSILNNKFYQAANRVYTTSNTHSAISVLSGSAYTITGNTIGYANSAGTGYTGLIGNTVTLAGFPASYTTTGTANATRFIGINCAFTAGGAVSNIQGNTISGIALYTSSSATTTNGILCGINVTSGNVNIGTVTGNTIGSTGAALGSLYAATTASGGVIVGIYSTSANTVNIQNNNIGSVDASGTSATIAGSFTGIDVAGAGLYTITNNNIGNATAGNIRIGFIQNGANLGAGGSTLTTTTGTSSFVGLRSSATGSTVTMNTNTLRGFVTSGSATAFTGITNTGGITGAVNINSNNLNGVNFIPLTNSGIFRAIYISSTGSTSTVSIASNNFQNITYSGASATASGEFDLIYGGVTTGGYTISNNTLTGSLTLPTTGSVYLIYNSQSTPNLTISNNNLTGSGINRTGVSGTMYYYYNFGSPGSGTALVTGNISNNVTLAGTSNFDGIEFRTGTSQVITITNNTVTNITGGSGTTYGIYQGYGALGSSISGNTINTISGGGTVYGIYVGSSAPTALDCFNNNVHTISTSGAFAAYGIYQNAGTTTNIFKNKIYDISGSAAGSSVNGIYISSGTTVNLSNNLIGDLRTPIGNAANPVVGLNISGGTTVNAYYNTVRLQATSTGALFGSSAISASTTPTLTLRNNIFINNSGVTGAGLSVAYRRSSTTLNTYSSASNNNIFFAGTPGASNLIFNDGTNSDQNLAAYRSRVATGLLTTTENASATEDVSFISTVGSSSSFLHVNTGTTWVESNGSPVAGITDDYDGDIRNVSTPDIGADEINATAYAPLDPPITFGSNTTTFNSFNITWVDNSIGESGFAVYRSLSISGPFTFITNVTSTTSGTTGTTYSLSQTGLQGNTTYYYQIYSFGGPQSATGLKGNATTAPCSSGLNGTYLIPGAYSSITAAITAMNTNGMAGPVILELDPTYVSSSEPSFPLTFTNNIGCLSASNNLTIRPSAAVASPLTITSANISATIDITGASNINIDGRPGGAGTNKYLAIENTSTTAGSAGNSILIRNEASTNLFTYLDIRSANANPPTNTVVTTAGSIPGAIAIGTTTGSTGNDNNTISYCNIHSTATGILGTGIYAGNGTTAGTSANNDNCTITNNNVYDFFIAGIASAAINISQGNNNWTISNNSIYQTSTRTYTSTQTVRGMWITPNVGALTSASGYSITGNFIGGNAPNCSGTAYTMTGGTSYIFLGMDLSLGAGTPSSVQGNTITNINMSSSNTSTTATVGISLSNGVVNIGTVTGNTIGSPLINTVPYGITFSTTGSLGGLMGIRASTGGPYIISNNTVAGIELKGDALTVAPSFAGINYAGGVSCNITNNTIGSASLLNSINLSSTSSTSSSSSSCRGIYASTSALISTISNNVIGNMNTNYSGTGSGNTMVGIAVATGTSTISGNTIFNLTSNSQGTGGGTTAAMLGIAYTASTAPAVISANTIYALKLTHPTTTAAITNQAIAYSGPSSGSNLIEKNNIHSISIASPSNSAATISGMDIASGILTIQNNMIRLGVDSNGTSIISPCLLRGISKNVATANIWNNSIYIGGTGVGTTATNTFALARTGTASDDIRDNIFVNNRSNASTGGKHYQVNLNATSTLTLNNNVYYGNGTGGLFGFNGTTDVGSYAAGWVSGDNNSYSGDPIYINPIGNAATGDLHINPSTPSVVEGNGVVIGSVTDDIDNQTRSGLTPTDIGADAGNFTPVSFMTYASSTTTQSNTTNVPTNSTNQVVIGIQIVTTGVINPLNATAFTVNTNGTTNVGDITNAKIFYTGNSAGFATTTQFGSTVGSPNGAFNIVGTQSLSSGTNYFWLTYDVPCSATIGNVIDAECTSVTVGSSQTPTVTAPAGSRTIIAGPFNGTYTVGTGGTYPTLTAAFGAISAVGLGGNVTLNILSNITEPGALNINQWSECGGSGFTIKIKPNTTATVSGSVASGALIKLNGVRNVIIDGSNSGGTDRSLTITNTNNTSPTAIGLASLGTALGATNITIKNCNISTALSGATGYGIAIGGSTPGSSGADNDNVIIQNNNITIATIGIYAIGTASVSAGGMDNLTITGNTINTNTTISNMGIQVGNGLNCTISQNIISVQTTTFAQPVGISLETGFISSVVSRNLITNVSTTATGGYAGRGITVGTGTASSFLTISNNVIYGVNGSNYSNFGNSSSMGIAIGIIGNSSTLTTTTGGINLYYNSVNLYGSYLSGGYSGASTTAALYIGSGATALDIRNNIFENTLNNPNASGTASKNYSIYSAGTNTAFTTINYNNYDTSTSQGVLGFLTSDRGDITAWRAASGQDVNSFSTDPGFNNNTNLTPQNGSPVLGAGTPVSVTIDYNGLTRNATNPSVGAYELGGDFTPPVITYTPLSGTCATGDRTLIATITDVSGVPVTGSLVPRVYYKKNAGQYFSQPGILSTGSGTSGTWTFNIVAADMSGVTIGDNISYFIIAQDIAPTPNVSSNPSNGLVASNVNTVTTPPTTPNSYLIQATLSGNINVGVGQTYTTLTAAVNAYNTSCISGPVTFLLTDGTYPSETFPITIASNAFASVTNTLTIKPALSVTPTITGNVGTGALIKFDGADYITIDGSNNGTSSRNLTISNSTTTTAGNAVLWLASPASGNGANYNTIKNCNIEGNASTTTFVGVYVGGSTAISLTSAGNELNNFNTINNNLFRKTQYGIAMFGYVSTLPDSNNIVSNNNFGTSVAGEGFSIEGIHTDRQRNLIVSGNDVQNVNGNGSTNMFGIRLLDFKTGQAFNNKVHDLSYTGTSITKIYGIAVLSSSYTTSANPSASMIYNNFVYKINSSATSTTWNTTGILANQGYGDKYYYNSIDLSGQINNSTSGLSAAFANGDGNFTTFCNNIDVRDNIFNVSGTSGGGNVWSYYTKATTFSGAIQNYNVFNCAGTVATNNTASYNGVNYATLSAWKAASGVDPNSVNTPPVFVSINDLHLVPGSNYGLNDLGTPVAGVTTDIDGDIRSATTPDMGADEFTTPPCTGAVGGTASGSGSFCGNSTTTITASGYSIGSTGTYKWLSAPSSTGPWTAIPGATNPASYTISPAVTTTTYYRLAVSCASGQANDSSTVVTITITQKPSVNTTPSGIANLCSVPGTLLLSNLPATNAVTPLYQWKQNGANIGGATSSSYTANAAGTYQLVITDNANGCKDSSTIITVTAVASPSVSALATPNPACLGGQFSLTSTSTINQTGYSVSSISYNPLDTTGSVILTNAGTNNLSGSFTGTLDDGSWNPITLPFNFNYYGTGYSAISINTNGYIQFGQNQSGYVSPASLPNAAVPNAYVGSPWMDLDLRTSGSVRYKIHGTSPNRIFSVSWAAPVFSGADNDSTQILLYEGSNVIEVHYAAFNNNSSKTYTLGVEDGAGANGTAAPNRNGATVSTPVNEAWRFVQNVITSYTWSGPNSFSSSVQNPPQITNIAANNGGLYTVTVTDINGCSGSGNTTVVVNNPTATDGLAGTTGGVQVCQSAVVNAAGTSYMDGSCNLIAKVVPSGGSSAVSGTVNACVKIDASVQVDIVGKPYVQRHNDIDPSTNPLTAKATLTLYFDQAEFDAYNNYISVNNLNFPPLPSAGDDNGNLRITQFHGTGSFGTYPGTTEFITPTLVWDGTRNRWAVTFPSTGFSGYFAHTGTTPLIQNIGTCPLSTITYYSNIAGTTYQWQVDAGTGFANISDNTVYSGSATNTLTLTSPPTSYYGYRYRCVVDGTNFSAVNTYKVGMTWTGAVSTDWSTAGNWSCSAIPDGNTDVLINPGAPRYPVVGANVFVRSLSVKPGASVTVNTGFNITITH